MRTSHSKESWREISASSITDYRHGTIDLDCDSLHLNVQQQLLRSLAGRRLSGKPTGRPETNWDALQFAPRRGAATPALQLRHHHFAHNTEGADAGGVDAAHFDLHGRAAGHRIHVGLQTFHSS